jgi:hypothetical protein
MLIFPADIFHPQQLEQKEENEWKNKKPYIKHGAEHTENRLKKFSESIHVGNDSGRFSGIAKSLKV